MITKCSHGKAWKEECLHCDLISAKETVASFGRIVERAQKRIEEIERKLLKEPKQVELNVVHVGLSDDDVREIVSICDHALKATNA